MDAGTLFAIGTLPFVVLGTVHILYTLLDIRAPTRLTPHDAGVQAAMSTSTLALTRQTTVWRAWLGFNLSHGMGVLFFGLVYLNLAVSEASLLGRSLALQAFAICMSTGYLVLSIKYWFHVPAIGSAIGSLCMIVATILMRSA